MTRGPLLRPHPVGQELVGLESPPDWDQVFGFQGPLELEIGCGPAHFALEYCARHPAVRYVAFEWRKKYAREAAHQAEQRGLKNLKVIEADARDEMPRLFRPGTLSVIHYQFPDPWWKRAHQKRSVLQPSSVGFLLELLVPGGKFDLRTDVEDRAQKMLAVLEGGGFQNPLGKGQFHPAAPDEIPSSRERRYLARGEPVYRAMLVKPG
jgi:tRNA (guanine-N7-)-methyltransferase